MSLKATVQNLQNRAGDARLSQSDRERFIDTWRGDVKEVYREVRTVLLQVIGEDAVTFDTEPVTISEEELGSYEIDRMTVTIVDRPIHLEPVARMTIGGTGRIDMYRHDRPSESNRIFIVRGAAEVDHAPDVWLIESRQNKTVGQIAARFVVRGYRTYVELSTPNIENAIDFLLNLA